MDDGPVVPSVSTAITEPNGGSPPVSRVDCIPQIPQTVHLRPVSLADAPFLWHMANNPILMDLLAELPTTLEDWQSSISQWNEDADEVDYIIARSSDELPVGWLGVNGLMGGGKMGWIKFIALLPEQWGRGYASSAIVQLKADLAARQIKHLQLWTDRANARAQRCYVRHGFRIIEEAVKPTGSRKEMRMRLRMECSL